MTVEYCPTDEMWADILTKPLQGDPFQKMRSMLMNMPEHYVDPDTRTTTTLTSKPNTNADGSTGVEGHRPTGVGPRNISFSDPIVTATHKIPRTQKTSIVKIGLPTRHPKSEDKTSRRRKSEPSPSVRRSVLGNIGSIPETSRTAAHRSGGKDSDSVRPSYKQILAGNKANVAIDKTNGHRRVNDEYSVRNTLGPDWPALSNKDSSTAREK